VRKRTALATIVLLTASLAAGPAAGAESRTAPSCGGKAATIWGTPGDDVLPGTPAGDVIAGLGGNDTITGEGGNDLICGGEGKDSLDGGKGKDRLLGGPGDDTLVGGGGEDTASFEESLTPVNASAKTGAATGEGTDTLAGIEVLKGSPFDDTLQGSSLFGGAGNDVLLGLLADDWLEGGIGNDDLRGLSGEDGLLGGTGDDVLTGGTGDDHLWSGPGRDELRGGDGADYLDGADGRDFLYGDDGDDRIMGGPGIDTLRGGNGHDTLEGGDDDDTLRGGGGDDVLDEDDYAGLDRLFGDADWDICWSTPGVPAGDTAADCEAVPTAHYRYGLSGPYVAPDTEKVTLTVYPEGPQSSASWYNAAGTLQAKNPGTCPAQITSYDGARAYHYFYVACAGRPAGAYRAACGNTTMCTQGDIGGWFVITPAGWRE
jgi:Ca2+-binding RTX toxin-like protein